MSAGWRPGAGERCERCGGPRRPYATRYCLECAIAVHRERDRMSSRAYGLRRGYPGRSQAELDAARAAYRAGR